MKLAETLPISPEALQAFSKAHQEAAWMTDLRTTALNQFESLEFPKFERMNYRSWPLTNSQVFDGPTSKSSLLDQVTIESEKASATIVQVGFLKGKEARV